MAVAVVVRAITDACDRSGWARRNQAEVAHHPQLGPGRHPRPVVLAAEGLCNQSERPYPADGGRDGL